MMSKTYQVVVSKVANVAGCDAKVREGLGRLVNLLVNEFPLHILSRKSWPPEKTVEQAAHRFKDRPRNIDVSSLLVNLVVYQRSDLFRRVVLGAVELEGLASCGVVV